METIQYVGEHLWPRILGHGLSILLFLTAALSALAFYRHLKTDDESWYKTGQWSFVIHGLSLYSIVGLILFIMTNKYYEYHYVWSHVSDDLPLRYILSAFWEGQEGSFILWMFWHAVLGYFLLSRRTKWTPGVMMTLALIQLFIASMILGVYIFEYKLGVSPFVLLRDEMDIPLFNNAQYLDLIDGNGLNPLLQNYWMTIHPPTLFLGFASTAIPFCFAVSAYIKNDWDNWLKHVLPWALFSAGALGTGILMGAAWAYEALSFGGYWAWDPVENTSLVPWLILLAGIHTNLIAKHTGRAIKSTLLYYLLGFVLVLYSTFLTRSGVLGDTSVHAFTEMGLEWQLILFLLFFTLTGMYAYVRSGKIIEKASDEESVSSREFWMFIGALILLFSSVLILFTTSLPVFNKIFDFIGNVIGTDLSSWHRTAPADPIAHYNKYQIWIASFIALFSGIAIWLRYSAKNWALQKTTFVKIMAIASVLSIILTWLLCQWLRATNYAHLLITFSAFFAILVNGYYLLQYLKFNFNKSASIISHVGFGLMVLGILTSGLNKEFISNNKFAMEGILNDGVEDRLSKNIMLIKNEPMFMNGWWVTYQSDTMIGNIRQYTVHYLSTDTVEKPEEFILKPQVVYDNKVTKVASVNPSTKHYWSKDIFTHIRSIPPQFQDAELAREMEDSLQFTDFNAVLFDTIHLSRGRWAVLKEISDQGSHQDYEPEKGDQIVALSFDCGMKNEEEVWQANPLLVLRKNLIYRYGAQVNDLKMRIDPARDLLDISWIDQEKVKRKIFDAGIGEEFEFNGFDGKIRGISKDIQHGSYDPEENDIAIEVIVDLKRAGRQITLRPVYLIRGVEQFNLASEDLLNGVVANINKIDPSTGKMTLELAEGLALTSNPLPIKIAEDVSRTDFIVLEAIEFPGINLFWLGSIMCMVGLFMGMARRRKKLLNAA